MKKYIEYLPEFLRNIEELYAIGNIEDKIIADEEKFFEEAEKSQWIETSEEKGLSRREKMLGISGRQTQSDEQRRTLICAKWNSYYPYTYYSMINWLENLCGNENFKVNVNYGEYYINIEITTAKKYLLDDIYIEARRMIPANMKLTVTLKYTKYGEICCTYGELKRYTYGIIKETDFEKIYKV